jgi:GTP-binding protein YchF
MQIGLLGLPRSGKTALFHALTGGAHEGGGGGDTHIAVIDVPDERLDRLVEVFRPKRSTPAVLQVVDLAGFSAGEGKGLTPQMLARLGTTEALCAVLRVFDDGSGDPPDPAGDLESLLLEMTISDLQKVENRLEKLPKQIMKLGGTERKAGEAELAVLERIRPALEEGTPIRSLGLTADEEPLMRGFQFLSLRPLLVVLNLGEGIDPSPHEAALAPALAQQGTELIALNAEIEMEIAQLDSEEDRRVFMEDFGLTEPGRDRLIRRLNDLLGLITFFTVSEKEVHAWQVPAGTPAQRAAGAIHSDMERGFIRAEVIHVDAFQASGSSMAEAKRHGQLRTEGKTYEVQDGEIFHVLFSV